MAKYITRTLLLLFFLALFFLYTIPDVSHCDSCSTLHKNNYTLEKYNIYKENRCSTIRDEGNGIFFIQPGTKSATKGKFTFKKNANLILTFSIRSGSKYGNIKFTIKKNMQEIKNFITTTTKINQLFITVKEKDTLTIIADKHGSAQHDWGNLKMEDQADLQLYRLSKIYHYISIYKHNIIMFLLLSIIIVLYIEFKTHPILQKFEENSPFIKIFQIVLFIWVFSIPLKNSLYQISTALLIILFLIHYFYYKQKDSLIKILTTYKKVLILFLLFITSMLLSTLLGISEKNEVFYIFKYIFRYMFILIILLYFYKQSFFSKKYLLSAIFIVLLIHSLDGMYQYFVGVDFIINKPPDGPSYLLTGAVYQHNPFGLFMAIGTSISLVLFSDKNNYTTFKYDKIIYFISLLMFIFTLFHSQSRAAWIMFGIFSLGYLFLYIKNNGIDKKLFYTISILLIFCVLFFIVDENLLHRLTLLLQGNSAGRTKDIWPFTIDKILDSPLSGYGINTYKLLATTPPYKYYAGVHNLTLEFLLYTGIIGFSIFVSIIWLTLKESFTESKIVYFILFLSFIVLMQFDGSLIDSKVHLNIFILLLFFIYSFRVDKNTSSK